MKIYIAGKITGDPNYKVKFAQKEYALKREGHKVMSPAILPEGFDYEDYMKVCYAMIDTCDAILLLPDWQESNGAVRERYYGWATKKIMLENGVVEVTK